MATKDKIVNLEDLKVSHDDLDGKVSDLKSDLNPLGLIGDTYTYSATSGYQNIPISIDSGTYKATCTNAGAIITFRDSNNTVVGNISIPQNANNYEFAITSEQASAIAYIRMYQGSVTIWATNNIVTRVDSLETEIETKADVVDVNAKADAEYDYSTTVSMTLESGVINKTGTGTYTGSDNYEHSRVNDLVSGDRYSISGICVNNQGNYTLVSILDANNQVISTPYTGENGSVLDFEFTIPTGASYMLCNFDTSYRYGLYKGSPMTISESVDKGVDEANSLANFYETQRRRALYNLSFNAPFAWGTFPKGLISWMNDDGRDDMYLYKDLCDQYNIPYANAVPYGTSLATRTIDSTPMIEYLQGIVSNGGEIFSHAGDPLTSASTEQDFYNQFVQSKRTLESTLNIEINGIIQAGGSGYSTVDYNKCQEYSIAYYQYSDGYGVTPQYTLARTRFLRSSYSSDAEQVAAFKAAIDDAVQNHKWIRLWCHGTDEVSIAVLTEVFEYASTYISAGTLEATTWKHAYDTYRSHH